MSNKETQRPNQGWSNTVPPRQDNPSGTGQADPIRKPAISAENRLKGAMQALGELARNLESNIANDVAEHGAARDTSQANTPAPAAGTERLEGNMEEKNNQAQPNQPLPEQPAPAQAQPNQAQPNQAQPEQPGYAQAAGSQAGSPQAGSPQAPPNPYAAMPPYGYPPPYGAYPYGYPPAYPPMMPPQMMPQMMPMGMPMQQPQAQQDERSEYEKRAAMRVVYEDGQEQGQPQQMQMQPMMYPGAYPYFPGYPPMMQPYGMYPPQAQLYPQTEQLDQEKKPEPADDYLAGMQVLYESDSHEIEESDDPDDLFIDTASIKDLYEDLAHTAKPLDGDSSAISTSLSDLFLEVEEGSKHKEKRSKRALQAILPWAGDSTAEKLRKIVMLLSIIAMIITVPVILWMYILEPQVTLSEIHSYSDLIVKNTDSDEKAAWAKLYEKHPEKEFPNGMLSKFAEAYLVNNDLAGWVSVPNIGIDYPVMQREDDADSSVTDPYLKDGNKYYLKHGMKHESSKRGIPFFEKSNNLRSLGRNTTIFGHNMQTDDLIFGSLEQYESIEGFQKAPLIYMSTLYKDYCFKVYAVFYSNGGKRTPSEYMLNYIFPNVSTDAVFETYIDELDRRKLYSTGVDIKPSDKILTLSTCEYLFDNCRLVVVGRLLRPGESEKVDTKKAVKNTNPQYPQIYYDKQGISNPFKEYEGWIPS